MANRLMIIYGMGDRLKTAMVEQGISQKQLAERCGCGRKTIMALANGQAGTSALLLARVCSSLNISADWLLGLKK